MFNDFQFDLDQKKKQALYREIPFSDSLLDFTSNDYLGLRNHPEIRKVLKEFLDEEIPLSSSASPLLGGWTRFHIEALQSFRDFSGRPSALVFSSGYQANLGVLPALAKKRVVFSDQLNHASLIDGIRLSGRPYHIFKHNDLNHLEDLMKKTEEPKLIVTESLFSMSGDFSNLEELSDLASQYKALLFVDEAHSAGLFGTHLSGRASFLKEKDFVITLHTGGKALAGSGAFLACSGLIGDYLINNCRSFIYSTAPSPLVMKQWTAVLKLLKKESKRAKLLKETALKSRQALGLTQTESPILFINLKSAELALKASQYLCENNYFIPAIRYPTVPKDNQGLRIVLCYDHKKEDLNQLIELIKNLR